MLSRQVHPGGEEDTSQDENMEPASKRRKGRWEEGAGGGEGGGRMVTAELVVYDKHSRCLLTEVGTVVLSARYSD